MTLTSSILQGTTSTNRRIDHVHCRTMKWVPQFGQAVSVLKSGLLCTLGLSGVCIILRLLANGLSSSVPLLEHLTTRLWGHCTFGQFMAVTGIAGFVLGFLVVKLRWLTVHRVLGPLAVVAVPLLIGFWTLDFFGRRVDVPKSEKLADCTNSVVSMHLTVPPGRYYGLYLVHPAGTGQVDWTPSSGRVLSGHIKISGGGSRAELPINAACLQEGLLTGDFNGTNPPPLSRFIRAREDYDIEVAFDSPPPASSSIWLRWHQSAKDRGK